MELNKPLFSRVTEDGNLSIPKQVLEHHKLNTGDRIQLVLCIDPANNQPAALIVNPTTHRVVVSEEGLVSTQRRGLGEGSDSKPIIIYPDS
ncbi:hypothetical protein ACFL2C_01335 [Patescibacteria group bacterium]